MTSATGIRSYIAMVKQDPATPELIPATPVMQKVNFVSDDLGSEITTKTSEHIREDRNTTDVTTIGVEVSGGYEFEFQYENSLFDELLLGFLWAQSWSEGGTLNEYAKNGNFYQPFFIERGHVDVDEYFKFIGMSCNELTLEFADQSDVVGSYSFMGLSQQVDPAVETGATYTPATSNPVFNTVSHITEIAIDGTPLTTCRVRELTIELSHNITQKTGLGVLGACETKPHRTSITGNITMYFEDSTMYDRLLQSTPFSIKITMVDGDSNSYIITLPRVKLDANTINVTGEDDDVMDDATYVATYDETLDCMIQIERTVAVP